ncbi:class I SAM-dependent methyltransferase [Rudanella lutea]|uniref:class I SAM-dependent methyltransferase n=1 Tax=Rudanella lutea TaxID=451374 RepID=UPI000382C00D|nr:hypothetical protein [Rudanella lutea]
MTAHVQDNVQQLLLRYAANKQIDIRKVAVQIAARQRVRDKLPTWCANPGVLFPQTLPLEQASSERTARYKATVVSAHTPQPNRLVDLTGGLGVDAWALASAAQHITYVERQAPLAELATHNFPQLACHNVEVLNAQSETVLQQLDAPVDWIYLDPARRDDRGGRVVRLDDCEPNVVAWWPLLRQKATCVLLKTSPLIDIEATLRQLPGIVSVQVVAVRHEVKEVLFVATPDEVAADAVDVTAVDLLADSAVRFSFRRGDERTVAVSFADPQNYLYEPNAAVLKAGAFRAVAERFGLAKLAPHSHLYTSAVPIVNFPGRGFKLEGICKPGRADVQALVPGMKANLTVRNYPQSVEELRKKVGLKEGGDVYIFATTLLNGDKRLLVTRKC